MTDPSGVLEAVEVQRTVVFVDLAGFTALVDTHGDRAALDVAERLVQLSLSELCPLGSLIKSIGDAVMLSFDTPDVAVQTMGAILSRLAAEPSFPLPCAGMHHGHVMAWGGDLFGRRVNIAARLAAMARPGSVLCTRPIADAAALVGVGVREIGPTRLRNVADPIVAFELDFGDLTVARVDPVCRMRVSEADAVRLPWDGDVRWFCSDACAELFVSRPAEYG